MLLYLFLNIMNENLFKYGSYEIDRDLLLQNIQQNVESWIKHYQYDDERAEQFRTAVGNIYQGISEGAVTGNGFGKFTDSRGIIQRSSATEDASNYIHSLTNQLGSALSKVKKEEPTQKKFNLQSHGFQNSFLKSLSPLDRSQEAVAASIQSYINSFNGDKTAALKNLSERIGNYQTEYANFADLDFSEHGITAEQYNIDLNTFKEQLNQGVLNDQLAIRLGFKPLIDMVYNKISVKEDPKSIQKPEKKPIQKENENENLSKAPEEVSESAQSAQPEEKQYKKVWPSEEEFNQVIKDIRLTSNKSTLPNDPTIKFREFTEMLDKSAKALYDSGWAKDIQQARVIAMRYLKMNKQGGILKAQTGIQFPNIDLLNHSKYQGWNKFFTYDQLTGTLSLNDGINQEEFNNWLTDNNLQFNNPTANYGKDYTKSGDYNSVYETNASSENWAGADFTNRSKNLSNLGNLNRQNELDLNSHVKSMYQNDSSQRNSDFINWFNVGKYSDLDSMLKAYNTEIDDAYKYKRSTEGTTYGQSEYTRAFNQSHKKRHASQNEIGGLYGYDEGSEHINGSTTMARGIDITNDDILLDVSSNNMLKEWLGDNQLWKDKSGRIYIKDTNGFTLSELNSEETPDKPKTPEKTTTPSGWGIGDGNDGPPPPPVVPEKKQTIDWGTLLSSANYFGSLLHNKKQLELNAELEPLYYDPKEDYRYTYGNLRAIAEGRQSAADIQRQAAKPMTSDGSLQTATSLEAATLAQKFINEGLKADDLALGESLEKAWEQIVENHENRYNIAMKNRENAKSIKDQKLLARMNRLRSDYESTINFIREMQTRLEAKSNERKTYRDYLYNQDLLASIENDPNGHLAKLGQPTLTGEELRVWRKGLINSMSLSDDELVTYQSIKEKISNIYTHYLGKEYGVDMPIYTTKAPIGEWKLDTSKIRSIVPGGKKGGKITSDMTKTIIAYLKESNKNYNKAIDRSIRGLYNHIKLQKK